MDIEIKEKMYASARTVFHTMDVLWSWFFRLLVGGVLLSTGMFAMYFRATDPSASGDITLPIFVVMAHAVGLLVLFSTIIGCTPSAQVGQMMCHC